MRTGILQGASQTSTQTNWQVAASGATAALPVAASYNVYDSKDAGIVAGADIRLQSTGSTATDDGALTTTGAATGGVFANGANSSTTVSGSGSAASVALSVLASATSTILSAGNVGSHNDVALDSNGKAHVVYYSYTDGGLRYATNVSGSWATSVIDASSAGRAAIAVDSNNKVHIIDANGGGGCGVPYYWTNKTGSWVSTQIDNDAYYADIAIDSNNKAHIAYGDKPCTGGVLQTLRYATDASGSFVTTEIDAAVSRDVSIALDPAGKVHIAYMDATNEDLKYATNASGSWVTQTLDSAGTVGYGTSIAAISSSSVHVTYADYTNDDVKYATNASGSWVTTPIDTGTMAYNTSLKLDSNNKLHVAYDNGWRNQNLKYATNKSGSWVITNIDGSPNSAYRVVGLAIDANDKYHISYYDDINDDLKYATNHFYPSSGAFTSATIDLAGAADFSTLAWNPAAQPAGTTLSFEVAAKSADSGWQDSDFLPLSDEAYPAGVTVKETYIRQDCTGYTAGTCYTSLSAWEAAKQRDLVAANEIEVAKIDGAWTAADTTSVTIDGWTTDATHYIKIYTTPAARHQGKWDTVKYRLAVSNNYRPFVNFEDYVRLDGLQISNDTAVDYGTGMLMRPNAQSAAATDIRISNNIIRTTMSNTGISGIDCSYGALYKIWNNIIYDFPGSAIGFFNGYGLSTAYVYHNTLYNNAYSAINASSGNTVTAKNNIVYGSGSVDAYIGAFAAGTDYNATDGTDNIGQGSNNKISQAFSFVDAANRDLRLASSDTAAKNSGVDLSADANLAVTTDILGRSRPTGANAVDIGAHEEGATTVPTTGYLPANLDNNRYVRYKAYLDTADTAETPFLNDVTVNYAMYPVTPTTLVSSRFDTGTSANFIKQLIWTESGINSGSVEAGLRSSADGSSWSGWMSYNNADADCSGSGTITCVLPAADAPADGASDQWLQYRVVLASATGAGTPAVDDITVEYDTAHLEVFAPDGLSASYTPTAGTPFNVTVLVRDSSGNSFGNHSGSRQVQLTASAAQPNKGACASSFNGGTTYTSTLAFSAGAAAIPVTLCDATAAGFTISAQETAFGALASTASLTIPAVNPDAASKQLVFATQPPAAATAGVNFTAQPVVSLQDQFGNVLTTATDSITLAAVLPSDGVSPGGGTLGAATNPLSASGGSAAFASVNYTKSEDIRLKASATGLTDVLSSAITVGAGPAAQASLSAPAPVTAGSVSGAFTLTSRDAFGNTANVTQYTVFNLSSSSGGTVTFYSDAGGTLPITQATISAYNSGAVFYYRDTRSGAATVTATVSTGDAIGSASATITVNPGPASQASLSAPASVTAGSVLGAFTLTSRDSSGNAAGVTQNTVFNLSSDSTGIVAFYSDAAGTVPITQTTIFIGTSSAVFYYKDTRSGASAVTAAVSTGDSLGSANASITVNPGPAIQLVISTSPYSVVAGGSAGAVNVQARDAFGNVVTGHAGTVSLSSSSSTMRFYPDLATANADTYTGGVLTGTGAVTSAALSAGQKDFWFRDTMASAPTHTITASLSTSDTIFQTSDTGAGDTPNAGGFNAGTKTDVVVSGTGTNAGIILSSAGYPSGVTVKETNIRQDCAGYTAGTCYTSLSAWEAAKQRDLVAANEIEVAKIDGAWTSADTTSIYIDGWTTDATHYIKIYTTPAARHQGKWDTNKYRLDPTVYVGPGCGDSVIKINESFVRIDGLQIRYANTTCYTGDGIFIPSVVDDVRISNNIIRFSGTATSYSGIYSQEGASTNIRIWNNIVYDFLGGIGVEGIGDGTVSGYVYNNTVFNCNGTGFFDNYLSMLAKNNIAQNCADGFMNYLAADSDYNISDLASDAPGANSKNSTTVAFVDAANRDLRLASSDTAAKNSGVDLSADANLAVTTDILGRSRPTGVGVVDIGAHEEGATIIPSSSGAFTSATIDLGAGGADFSAFSFSQAITGGAAGKAWGYDGNGQLGDDADLAAKSTPVSISGIANATAIVAAIGGNFSLTLLSDGTIKSWGYNADGQLGDGTTMQRAIPVSVTGINNAVAIAAGTYHGLALLSDGTVKGWGWNYDGELGDGTGSMRTSPVTAGGGINNAVAIAAGGSHSLVLLADGAIRAFGTNVYGELGNGATSTQQRTPVSVSGITNAVAIAAGGLYGNVTGGNKFSLALLSDGTVKSWGDNTYGQLGDGTTTQSLTPVSVSGITNAVAIAAGPRHALALLSDGTIKAWGGNTYGQLGDGTVTQRLTPVSVSGITNAVAIAAGGTSWGDFSIALLADGTVKAWGNNGNGQLGDGTTTQRLTPVPANITNAVAVAAGSSHTLAITGGIRFQIAVNNDNATWNYSPLVNQIGHPARRIIPASLDNNRYVRYKAYLDTADTSYTPALNDVTVSYYASGTSQTETVTPGVAASLVVSGIADTVAGTASSVTVTAYDSLNNIAAGYTGTVSFTSSDPQANLPGAYTFTPGDAGVRTFTNGVTLRTAGVQSVTAGDGTLSGTQSNITVTPASLGAADVVPPGYQASQSGATAGVRGNATVSFTAPASNWVPGNGRIVVTFAGAGNTAGNFSFNSGGTTAAAIVSGLDGTLSVANITGQAVTVERAGGTGASGPVSFTLSNVRTPSAAFGSTGNYSIQIQNSSGGVMAEETAVAPDNTFGVIFSSPAAGTQWSVGDQNLSLAWSESGTSNNFVLQYYNGAWLNAQNDGANISGAFTPGGASALWDTNSGFIISSSYRIRAYDTARGYSVGESDLFTMKGGISLSAPASGAKWSMDAPHQISWATTGTFSSGVRLTFSTDSTDGTNGTWTALSAYPTSNDASASTNILNNADNNGITAASAWWLPSRDMANGEASLWIKVSDANTSAPASSQAAAITVSDIANVDFTLPDRAGTAVKAGADLNLNITSTGVTNVTIEYKSNAGGGTYVTCQNALAVPASDILVSGLPFVWRVPDDVYPAAGADIRVSASSSSAVEGALQQTSAGFTIYGDLTRAQTVSGTYQVNDPNNRVPIVWSGSSSISAITFQYNLDAVTPNWQNAAGVGVGDIYNAATGGTAGTYNWAGGAGTAWWQPKFTTGGVYIRVVDTNDTATYSPTNLATEAFSISGISVLGVTATSSSGDISYLDTLTVGTTRYIKGTGSTQSGSVNIYYDTTPAFTSPVPAGTAPLVSGAYARSWTVPDVISDTVYFKVTDPGNEGVVYSISAAPVSIRGGLTVNTPGSAWVVGSTAASVTGTVTGDIDVVDMQYTTAASPLETDWANAAAGLSIGNHSGTTGAAFTIPAGSFTVPDAISAANFKIRVKDATVGRGTGLLTSSAASSGFQVKGLLAVTSPSAADTWYAGRDATIGYSATGSGLGNFRIYYGYRKAAAASNNPADYTFDSTAVLNTTSASYFGSGTGAAARSYAWSQVPDVVEILNGAAADEQDPSVYEAPGNQCWMMMRLESDNADTVYSSGFRVEYYKVTWRIKNLGGAYLATLNVSEPVVSFKPEWNVGSYGVASSDTGSTLAYRIAGAQDFDRYYPYYAGTYSTTFTEQAGGVDYPSTVTWMADSNKIVSVYIDTEPTVDKKVVARTSYEFETGVLNISSWLESKGLPLTAAQIPGLQSVEVRIYDAADAANPISPASPVLGSGLAADTNGVYWITWNAVSGGVELQKGRQYLIKSKITYNGVPYEGSDIFTLETPLMYSVQIDPAFTSVDKMLMNVSLLRSGVLVSDLAAGDLVNLIVFDDGGTDVSGNLNVASTYTTLDTAGIDQGIYHTSWNPAADLSSGIVYTIVAQIAYKGNTYSGTKAVSISGDLSGIDSKIDAVQTSIGAATDAGTASTLFGRIAAVKAQTAAIQAETDKIQSVKDETDKITTQVIPKVDTLQTTVDAVKSATDRIGVIEQAVTADLVSQIDARATEIKQQITDERKLEVMTRSATVKPDTAMTIRCRNKSGAPPALTIYNPSGTPVFSQAMTEASTTGIYSSAVTFASAWGTGDFSAACSESGKIDSIVMSVQANDFDTIFAKVGVVESKLDSLTTVVNTIDTNTGGVSTDIGTLLTRLGSFGDTDISNTLFGEMAGARAKTDTIVWADVTAARDNAAALVSEIGTGNIAAIRTKTDTVNWGDVTGLVTATGAVKAKTDTIDWTQVAAIKTATDTINWGDVTGIAAAAGAIQAKTDTINWTDISALLTEIGTGNISAIKTRTDTIDWADVTGIVTTAGVIQAKTDIVNWADIAAIKTNTAAINWNDVIAIDANADAIRAAMGTSADDYSDPTLFGKISAAESGANVTLLTKVDALQAAVGAPTDTAASGTLFGRIGAGGFATAQTDTVLEKIKGLKSDVEAARDVIIGYVDEVESSVGTSSDTAQSDTVFGRISGMEALLASVGADATNAVLYAREARAQAMTINETVADIRASLGEGDINAAVERLGDLGGIMVSLQESMGKIPDGVGTQTLLESIQETLDNLKGVAETKGYGDLVPAMTEEFKPVNPEDVNEIRNNVSGLKSLMLEIRGLLDKEVNKPIVHGWLEETE